MTQMAADEEKNNLPLSSCSEAKDLIPENCSHFRSFASLQDDKVEHFSKPS